MTIEMQKGFRRCPLFLGFPRTSSRFWHFPCLAVYSQTRSKRNKGKEKHFFPKFSVLVKNHNQENNIQNGREKVTYRNYRNTRDLIFTLKSSQFRHCILCKKKLSKSHVNVYSLFAISYTTCGPQGNSIEESWSSIVLQLCIEYPVKVTRIFVVAVKQRYHYSIF